MFTMNATNRAQTSILFILALGVLFLNSCNDDDFPKPLTPQEQLEKDQQLITDYLDEKGIDAEADSVYGIRYVIVAQGTGPNPTVEDTVDVDYTATRLWAEEPFDQGTDIVFPLKNLIPAWQILLPYLKEGGRMVMYVPSGYAYGPQYVGTLPPNSNLVFVVTLNDVVRAN